MKPIRPRGQFAHAEFGIHKREKELTLRHKNCAGYPVFELLPLLFLPFFRGREEGNEVKYSIGHRTFSGEREKGEWVEKEESELFSHPPPFFLCTWGGVGCASGTTVYS